MRCVRSEICVVTSALSVPRILAMALWELEDLGQSFEMIENDSVTTVSSGTAHMN